MQSKNQATQSLVPDSPYHEKAAEIQLVILDIDGVLTDGRLYYGNNGEAIKVFDVKDGLGIKQLQKAGIEVALLSNGRSEEMVLARAQDLGIKTVYVGRSPKITILESWLKERALEPTHVAYIGDDLNDIPVLEAVGLSACPHDAVDAVKKTVDIQLAKKGGRGAVREFSDHLLTARQATVDA